MDSHDVMSLLSRDSLHHINNIIVVCVVMLSSREDPNGLSRCNVPTLQRQFSTTFLRNCRRSTSLGISTCHVTVVVGKQGHAPPSWRE